MIGRGDVVVAMTRDEALAVAAALHRAVREAERQRFLSTREVRALAVHKREITRALQHGQRAEPEPGAIDKGAA